ncbi:hypothetical protein JTE90_017741 [Oedothorax gibbosus]|uniref:Uncharacterized protein n=1 Tax=Oedothorax gibbosus TaxID=931172 RepID=A0AAV6TFS3_9ARAC|nr:hypothetical protein JTE90_017741 [Oedothorax gibbosus]
MKPKKNEEWGRNGLTLHFFWVSCVANVDSNGAANHCELSILYNCLSIRKQEQFPCPTLEMICSTRYDDGSSGQSLYLRLAGSLESVERRIEE